MKLKEKITKKLSPLAKEKFYKMSRAGNMLCLHLGDVVETTNRKGIRCLIGHYALHIQCPWRLCCKANILVASGDFYYPSQEWLDSNGFKANENYYDTFDWGIIGNNRFDEKAKIINEYVQTSSIVVDKIVADNFGGLKLYFSNNYIFEAFPCNSDKREHWRFFSEAPDKEHYVVFEED